MSYGEENAECCVNITFNQKTNPKVTKYLACLNKNEL